MKSPIPMKLRFVFFYFLSALFFGLSVQSCKKDRQPDLTYDTSPSTGTRTELTLDSIYLYARQIYLWNDQLPTYDNFDPRKYNSLSGSVFRKLSQELFDITQIPRNPATGESYEFANSSSPKYSYISDDGGGNGIVATFRSDVSLEGLGDDFGFKVAVAEDQNNNRFLFIRSVETDSPADEAGLKRGYRITRINNANVDLSTTTGLNNIDNAMQRAQIKVEGQRNDAGGTSFNNTVSRGFYSANPIYLNKVIDYAGKKVGYLAYARFSNLGNSESVLNEAFQQFTAAGVTDLILDFRYNGGGYVSTAEHMMNLISPTSLNGKTMFIEHYNDIMRSGKAIILKNQFFESNGKTYSYFDYPFDEKSNTSTFEKAGALNTVKNVYFIVSGNTASASELVINSLKPYLNVKLIGTTTYGKPVGFFPITIDNWEVYLTSFESRNANNEGRYYAGMKPNVETFDDVTKDFGDPAENCLAKTLALVGGTSPTSVGTKMSIGGKTLSASGIKIEPRGTESEFKGMIEDRIKLKKK